MNHGYRVVLPYACYTLEIRAGVVMRAPPIAEWMLGRLWRENVLPWISMKGGRVEELRNFAQG